MATHSSILAWKIPWTEEPGRLQSTGTQRVGLNNTQLVGQLILSYFHFLFLIQVDFQPKAYVFFFLIFCFTLFTLKKNVLIYFLATLGLCCCQRAFCSFTERGPLFIANRGLLIAVASHFAEHGL